MTLELGGKSPNIILPDANLKKAIPGALNGVMFNQGRYLCAGSRVFIHKDKYDEVVSEMVSYAKSLQQGAGLHQDTQIGPLVSQEQHERVLHILKKEKRKEPKLSRAATPFEEGYFVSPTVFADVDDSMTIAKEEIFGPVLAAIPYDTVDEVIERANCSEYGLATWTLD